MSKTSSDLPAANQTSNGVHSVRSHLLAVNYLVDREKVINFNPKLAMKMKAEV